LINSSTTKSSPIFDKIGVNEISQRCLLTSHVVFFFGTGIISASFHCFGKHVTVRRNSLKYPLRDHLTGRHSLLIARW
jgi:hypothetical protein